MAHRNALTFMNISLYAGNVRHPVHEGSLPARSAGGPVSAELKQ